MHYNNRPTLIIWYKKDETLPIYRYDSLQFFFIKERLVSILVFWSIYC
jgi:hypothetical protein